MSLCVKLTRTLFGQNIITTELINVDELFVVGLIIIALPSQLVHYKQNK